MPIQVVCPGCHKRFKVSDKYAGQKGPCPKCKAPIQIPKKGDEVVIHEPEQFEGGGRGTTGKLTLKPIERTESKLDPMLAAGFGGGAIVAILIALVMRMNEGPPPAFVLYLGAIALAPPLCWGGYQIFRNEEDLEPFRGLSLAVRTAICSLAYAGLWWLFGYIYGRFWGADPAEVFNVFLTAPPFLLLGAATAFCCYDLEFGNGFFHYCLYLVVTILLRLVMGMPAVGPAPQPSTPEENPLAWLAMAVGFLV